MVMELHTIRKRLCGIIKIKQVKKYMVTNKRLNENKSKNRSLRSYCIVSVLLVLMLNVFVYFHASVSILNTVLIVFFLIFYFKKIKKSNTRKSTSLSYIVSIILCGSFSILMFLLLVIAFILSLSGEVNFNQLITTI